MKTVWEYVKRYKIQTAALIILSVLSMASTILTPYLNGIFIDELITSKNLNSVYPIALTVVVIGLAGIITSYFVNISVTKMVANSSFEMIEDTITHIQKIPMNSYSGKFASSYLIRRIIEDTNVMFSFFLNNFVSVFLNMVILISILAVIFTIDSDILLISLGFIPVYYACYIRLKDPLFHKNKNLKEVSNQFSKTLFEQLESLYEIKLDGSFRQSRDKQYRSYDRYFNSLVTFSKTSYLFNSLDGMIAIVFQSIILFVAGTKILSGSMTIGEFTIVNTYFITLLSCAKYYFNLGKSYQDYRSSESRMLELYSLPEENNGMVTLDKLTDIDVVDATYSYDATKSFSINDISTSFKKGRLYLVIGSNGSGKTTLMNIVLGIIQDLDSGHVRYDGVNMEDIDLYDTRSRHFSISAQNQFYPDSTVGDYLEGCIGHTKDEILEMLDEKGLNGVLFNNSFGLDEVWNMNINTLSGGQKRKIALLKTLWKDDCLLLLMDEPTNYLDSTTVDCLIEHISSKKASRITIIISHDERFVPIADEIINLESHVLRFEEIGRRHAHSDRGAG